MRWYDARWFIKALRQYADFGSRAQRAEYWMFSLISTILAVALGLIDTWLSPDTWIPILGSGYGPVGLLYNLAVLVPTVAVGARRLHDTGHTGWWQLLVVIPFFLITAIGPLEPVLVVLIVGIITGVMGVIGGLILLIMLVTDGTPEPNKWGVNPKAGAVTTPDPSGLPEQEPP